MQQPRTQTDARTFWDLPTLTPRCFSKGIWTRALQIHFLPRCHPLMGTKLARSHPTRLPNIKAPSFLCACRGHRVPLLSAHLFILNVCRKQGGSKLFSSPESSTSEAPDASSSRQNQGLLNPYPAHIHLLPLPEGLEPQFGDLLEPPAPWHGVGGAGERGRTGLCSGSSVPVALGWQREQPSAGLGGASLLMGCGLCSHHSLAERNP